MQRPWRPLTLLGDPSPPMSPQPLSDDDYDDVPPLTPDDSPVSSTSPSPTDDNFNSRQFATYTTSTDMGLFKKKGERKGKDTLEPQNPYAAQSTQDQYTSQAPPQYDRGNHVDRPEKSPAWTTQDQRFGNGGSYGRNGAYSLDKFDGGAQSSPSRPGGYGGLGPADDRSALFGAAPDRYQPSQQPAQSRVSSQNGGSSDYGQVGDYGSGPGYKDEDLTPEQQEKLAIRDIKQRTNDIRGQSAHHLNNGLQAMEQAIETGAGTIGRLYAQGDQLHNAQRKIMESSSQARVGAERTAQLKIENRSMFMPRFGHVGSKSAAAEEDRALENLHREQAERANLRAEQRGARTRADQFDKQMNRTVPQYQKRTLAEKAASGYEFDDSDDSDEEGKRVASALEDEIDEGLHRMQIGVGTLKSMALVMNDEVDYQNKVIDATSNQAQGVQDSLERSRNKLSQIR